MALFFRREALAFLQSGQVDLLLLNVLYKMTEIMSSNEEESTFDGPLLSSRGEVGGWGRDPKKFTGRDWGMGSSTI